MMVVFIASSSTFDDSFISFNCCISSSVLFNCSLLDTNSNSYFESSLAATVTLLLIPSIVVSLMANSKNSMIILSLDINLSISQVK